MVLSNVLYCFIFPKANTNGLQTHMVMEPFAVAAWRQLPSVHPVFKIIFPHLRTVMAVNNFIRHNLEEQTRSDAAFEEGLQVI